MGKRKQNVSCNRMHHSCFSSLALVGWVIFLTACTSLKKAALIGGGALVPGAIASVATSGTAPVLLASAVGASVTSVVADVMTPSKGGSMPTAASCAPDNFWTLLRRSRKYGRLVAHIDNRSTYGARLAITWTA